MYDLKYGIGLSERLGRDGKGNIFLRRTIPVHLNSELGRTGKRLSRSNFIWDGIAKNSKLSLKSEKIIVNMACKFLVVGDIHI